MTLGRCLLASRIEAIPFSMTLSGDAANHPGEKDASRSPSDTGRVADGLSSRH